MCKIMEELMAQSADSRAAEIALNLLQLGVVSKEKIAKATGLTLEDVEKYESLDNGMTVLAKSEY